MEVSKVNQSFSDIILKQSEKTTVLSNENISFPADDLSLSEAKNNQSGTNIWKQHKVLAKPEIMDISIIKAINTDNNICSSEPETKELINSDSKVLHIGDSHTVGAYGRQIDDLMRVTGARVTTVGSAGSSPSWWLNGTETKSGFYSEDEDGNIDSPVDWKTPHPTPKLTDLIEQHHPNIIIFSLGANLVHANAETIEKEVAKVLEIAKQNNVKIVWVGPPNSRADLKPPELQDFLYSHIQKVVAEYGGAFVDSRPYTNYPDNLKGDGIHFSGAEGTKIAKEWSNQILQQIQTIE